MTTQRATVFDRAVAKQAADQLKAILAGAGVSNFEFDIGTGSFTPNEFTVKVNIRIKGGVNPERQRLESACKLFGFDPDATLESSTRGPFKLVNYNNRSPKYPWIVKYLQSGQDFKVPHDTIELAYRRLAEKKASTQA